MLTVLLVSIFFVVAAFALFSIRILLKKDGTFRGTCAGNSPFLKKDGVVCGVCGKREGEACGEDSSKVFTAESRS